MRHSALWSLFCIAALSIPSDVLAGETSWAGKWIFTKRHDIRIGYTDDRGRQVYTATLTGAEYRVIADKNGWIKVRQNDVEGWFSKEDAVVEENAVTFFTNRIRANRDDSDAYLMRGTVWFRKGEYNIAVRDHDEAIRLDPDWHNGYHNRGMAWHALKEYDKAIRDFTEAIRLDPRDGYHYDSRGDAYLAKGDLDKALRDFNDAIRVEANFPYAFNNRGRVWLAKKEWEKAIKDLDEALRLDPNYETAFANRGQAWDGKKDYGKALSDYESALRIDPEYAYALNQKAWLLATCPDATHRDGAKAITAAKKACELTNNKDWNYIDTLAAAHAEAGQFDDAVRLQTQALKLAPEADQKGYRERLELFKKGVPVRQ